jgi:PAS domain S-box-containing protein
MCSHFESIEHAVCQLSALAQDCYPGHRVPTMVESCLIEEGVVVDVTKRANIDIALKEQEALFRVTMNAAQVGIFVVQNAVFCFANDFLLNAFGYTAEELINNLSPIDLVVPEQRAMLREQMRRRAAGEPGEAYEIAALRKDGSSFPARIVGTPAIVGGLPASVGTLVDISEHKAAEKKIRELADFDVLTGLPNRRLLHDRFAQMIAAAERDGSELALMFLDLDHFKRSMIHSAIVLVTNCFAPFPSVWPNGYTQDRYAGPPWR